MAIISTHYLSFTTSAGEEEEEALEGEVHLGKSEQNLSLKKTGNLIPTT